MRIDLTGNPTYLELLDRVRQATLDAYNHPEVPFMQLAQQWRLDQEVHHSVLFQTMFNLQNAPIDFLKLPDLSIEPLALGQITSRYELTLFDLDLTLEDRAETLRGELRYCTDLFDPPTIVRMVEDLRQLLKEMIIQPDCQPSIGVAPNSQGAARYHGKIVERVLTNGA